MYFASPNFFYRLIAADDLSRLRANPFLRPPKRKFPQSIKRGGGIGGGRRDSRENSLKLALFFLSLIDVHIHGDAYLVGCSSQTGPILLWIPYLFIYFCCWLESVWFTAIIFLDLVQFWLYFWLSATVNLVVWKTINMSDFRCVRFQELAKIDGLTFSSWSIAL